MKKILLLLTIGSLSLSGCQEENPRSSNTLGTNHYLTNNTKMQYKIPNSLQTEHAHLHKKLEKALSLEGKTGKAAKEVANLLHHHFVKEEEYAMPPLGLLEDLANGKVTSEMKGAIELSERLKNDMPKMLEEHRQIVEALKTLMQAAKEEGHPEVVEFAENLKLHAQTEEEVLYPTAILIGEYLKMKLSE